MFSSGQKILLGVVGFIVFALIVTMAVFSRGPGGQKQSYELSVWGVKDSAADMRPLFDDFVKYYKSFEGNKKANISISYTQLPEEYYEKILLNALAEDRGPDIFFIHNTWLTQYQTKLSPLPEGFITLNDYEKTFMPTATVDLVRNEQIYAFPLYIDSLALYYNIEQYQDAHTSRSRPQSTWSGLLKDSAALAIINSEGTLRRGGIALGGAHSVTYAPDIFSLLLLQFGGNYCDLGCTNVTLANSNGSTRADEEALKLLSQFTFPRTGAGSWNDDFVDELRSVDSDIDAFVTGQVSAIIGYQELYPYLKQMTGAQGINMSVAEIPQVTDPAQTQSRDALANYWAPAVSIRSNTSTLAWNLIMYLSSQEMAGKYHTTTGRPTARQDLITLHELEVGTGIFAQQAKYAKSVSAYEYGILQESLREILADYFDNDLSLREALIAIEEEMDQMLTLKKMSTPPSIYGAAGTQN